VSLYKYLLIGAVCVFGVIAGVGMLKKGGRTDEQAATRRSSLSEEISLVAPSPSAPLSAPKEGGLGEVDRIAQLFALDSSRLPIVETLSYTSRVPWLEGRPAWVVDYASHYETSRHFIARSLNRKPDYLSQKISPGDRFNVFRKDKNIEFHLLIDLSRCCMRFSYIDLDTKEEVVLKTYRVGLGRIDPRRSSGLLTPLGKYRLGGKVAIYKPGMMGTFQEKPAEMIRIFGTRWIPFEKELEGCSEPARGLGIHGAPWLLDANGTLVEDTSKIGKYDSDGCIRLAQQDIEELFSIIITKPTLVELVQESSEQNSGESAA
jgi:hypothetical protein